MAKSSNMLGKFRGKMGGMVFRVDPDAGQVVSEYNAHPANPRTLAQTNQRNKMSLAGQISKITPYLAIAGLGINKRKARAGFVSNIIKNVDVQLPSGNVHTASLNTTALMLSKGEVVPLTMSASYATATKKLTVSITNNNETIDVVGYRVVLYITENMEWRYCTVKDATAAAVGVATTVAFDIPASAADNPMNMGKAYVIPIIADNAEARTRYTIFLADTNMQGGTMDVNVTRTLVSDNAFAASQPISAVALDQA